MAVSVHKWTVRLLLVFLIYRSANARMGHLEWMELADEINNKQWCGKIDYCGSRNQPDNPSATESLSDETTVLSMTAQKPNDMKENKSVFL